MQLVTWYDLAGSRHIVQLQHNGRFLEGYMPDKDLEACEDVYLYKQAFLQAMTLKWNQTAELGSKWELQLPWRAGTEPMFKEIETTMDVLNGEVVDAERTSIGDRRGTETAERVLDSPNRERLAIQAPRDRGDGNPEEKAAAE